MAKVTYIKMDPSDPDTTEWDGRPFRVGEAVDFDARKEEHKSFVERAKLNPAFDVDGNRKEPKGQKRSSSGEGSEPSTSEEYRAYALDWINKSTSAEALERRWRDEETLRERVGWGADDQRVIEPILEPKIENLKRAESQG